MLFTSFGFIFLFLPVTVVLYFCFARLSGPKSATFVLIFASLLFYCWWNPPYLVLLVLSILFNYTIAKLLDAGSRRRKLLLIVGIVGNLSAIGYFKYTNFFLDTVNSIASTEYFIPGLIVPLGLSFFTFQQIAFLVDVYKKQVADTSLVNYALFVSFFPQLIAGPIVHHKEMMPQFLRPENFTPKAANLAMGLSLS